MKKTKAQEKVKGMILPSKEKDIQKLAAQNPEVKKDSNKELIDENIEDFVAQFTSPISEQIYMGFDTNKKRRNR
jgi:hypothetical protein